MPLSSTRVLRRAWLAALSAIPAACFGVPSAAPVTATPVLGSETVSSPSSSAGSTTTPTTTSTTGATTTTASTTTVAPRVTGTILALDFNETATGVELSTGAPRMTGLGAGKLTSRILTANYGVVKVASAPDPAQQRLYRLPTWQETTRPALAAVSIANKTTTDQLAVGKRGFQVQAEFSEDIITGTDPADGDNVLQRGLATGVQWKIQADHLKLSCAIRGYDPSNVLKAVVTPAVDFKAGIMHRVRCTREVAAANTAYLTMQIWRWNGTSWAGIATRTATDTTLLDLRFPASIPLSVGAKLATATEFDTVADQLNGRVDNVSFALL